MGVRRFRHMLVAARNLLDSLAEKSQADGKVHSLTTQHEQWDIVSGVGITALAVAAGRAIEHERADRIAQDPYAAALVQAADAPQFASAEVDDLMRRMMADYLGVRTRFFDEFFLRATASGAQQAVILASGLDTRAFRLNWPAGVTVFEIDQPKVLEFKDSTLEQAGAQPNAERHALPVDLRDDWAGALKEAGFDPSVPTAWLAEGLLPYLPAAAEAQLLETVDQFSAPGSRISIEHFAGTLDHLDNDELNQISQQWDMDLESLFSHDEKPDVVEELRKKGWQAWTDSSAAVAAGYGRELTGFPAVMHQHGSFVVARKDS